MSRITKASSVIYNYIRHNKYSVFSPYLWRRRRKKRIPPTVISAASPIFNADYAREELANRQGPEEMDRGMPDEEWFG